MSETLKTGDPKKCAVCGKPLTSNPIEWRRLLFCSQACEQEAFQWPLNKISALVGDQSSAQPSGGGGMAAPSGKGQPGHAGDAETNKSSAR